jgi:hypothetical protein
VIYYERYADSYSISFFNNRGYLVLQYGQVKDAGNELLEVAKKEKINEKRQKEIALEKGISLNALIIDKKEIILKEASTLGFFPIQISSTSTMLPTTIAGSENSKLSFRIYANDKNYDIEVPKSLYQSKSIGDYLKIKLYKDRIVLNDISV